MQRKNMPSAAPPPVSAVRSVTRSAGKLTPWGGSWLKEKYGKGTEGDLAAESLEVSCIPGLESTDAQGRKLPDLIREYGEKLVGGYVDKPFPLLLKLLDVRDWLSVQVHPNDEYAAAREDGKTGKDEAWLVLAAPPEGGEVVYGVRRGTSRHAMREACVQLQPQPHLRLHGRLRLQP